MKIYSKKGIQMNQMMNMMMNVMNNNFNENIMENKSNLDENLNIIFVDTKHDKRINVIINKQKKFQEAIDLYRLKSGNNKENLRFMINNFILDSNKKIYELEIANCSEILVIYEKEVYGG